MNLLLIEAHELAADGLVELGDRRAEHLVRVLRVEPGDEVRVGLVGGGQGRALVEAIKADSGNKKRQPPLVTLRAAVEVAPPPRPEIDLILGLPRPAVLHRVLQHAATIGVGSLDLVNAWKVEKSYFQSPATGPEAIRRHLLLGAEQGCRTFLPEVRLHRLLVPFIENLGPAEQIRLLAHPAADRPIEAAFVARQATDRVLLAIGPEGGWIEREVATFKAHGFASVTLGPFVLRSEAALTAALAQLALIRRLRREPPAVC